MLDEECREVENEEKQFPSLKTLKITIYIN